MEHQEVLIRDAISTYGQSAGVMMGYWLAIDVWPIAWIELRVIADIWIFAVVALALRRWRGRWIWRSNVTVARTITALMLMVVGWAALLWIDGWSYGSSDGSEQSLPIPKPLLIMEYIIIMPVIEEVLFRLMLHGQLQRVCGSWTALWVQAVMFALYHQQRDGALFYVCFGFIMGALRLVSGRLWPSTFIHCLWNYHVLMPG
jgi:membrane protease YdiL (CAAX protease family)